MDSNCKSLSAYFILNAIFILSSFISEASSLSFTHISTTEGLSQSTILSIAQDSQGAMWFATMDGLNKYDGYSFTVYRHNPNFSSSISDNIIQTVRIDAQGKLWIGTNQGLSYYNHEKDIFDNFKYQVNNQELQVYAIEEIGQDSLLLGTQQGIILFNSKEKKFISPLTHHFACFCILKTYKEIYIGSDDGLFTYDINEQKMIPSFPIFRGIRIQTILQQAPDKLWVATEGSGLFLINLKTKNITNYRHEEQNIQSLSSNYIRALALDEQNKLWIGTLAGLNIYSESTDSFERYEHNPKDNYSLSQNSIRSLFLDTQKGMWIGTYFGGINYHHKLKNRFHHIHQTPYQNSLNDNVISCITEDQNHNLWIGTNDNGINFYDTAKHCFYHYTTREGLSSNNIKAIYLDTLNNQIYIGTHGGGMNVLDRDTNRIKCFTRKNSSLTDPSVYTILPWQNGTLLLGVLNGLIIFNPENNTFTPVLSLHKESGNHRITVLYQDSLKRLWIGGEKGLDVYDYESSFSNVSLQNFFNHPLLSKAFILCIAERNSGEIWIGTREGLFSVNEHTHKTQHYTTQDGLPNNVIYGILFDKKKNLWMSTNNGICRFAPESGNFQTFTQKDGIQNKQFNTYSYCKTDKGEMLFGGINGITTFYPDLLNDNPYAPPVIINNFKILGKSDSANKKINVLNKNIDTIQTITLHNTQSSFSIGFVVSNYISGEHNYFKYRLSGYQEEWQISNERTATYSDLPHGHYVFQVNAANNSGKWSDEITEMEIIILPVWYKSQWFIRILFLIGITILLFFFRNTLSVLLSKYRLLPKKKRPQNYNKTNDPIILEENSSNIIEETLLKQAVSIIEKNMDNPLFSVEEFAKEMNMSRSSLHLKLKAITGESAITFIHKIKFRKACVLLKEGKYSISEISTMVGFTSPSYFTTSFKKYVGCLPSEYIKNQFNKIDIKFNNNKSH